MTVPTAVYTTEFRKPRTMVEVPKIVRYPSKVIPRGKRTTFPCCTRFGSDTDAMTMKYRG